MPSYTLYKETLFESVSLYNVIMGLNGFISADAKADILFQTDRSQHLIPQDLGIMSLIALTEILVPFIFSAAKAADVKIPGKVLHSAHDFTVVFQIIKCLVIENKVIASRKRPHLKVVRDSSAVIGRHTGTVKISAFSVYLIPACRMPCNIGSHTLLRLSMIPQMLSQS